MVQMVLLLYCQFLPKNRFIQTKQSTMKLRFIFFSKFPLICGTIVELVAYQTYSMFTFYCAANRKSSKILKRCYANSLIIVITFPFFVFWLCRLGYKICITLKVQSMAIIIYCQCSLLNKQWANVLDTCCEHRLHFKLNEISQITAKTPNSHTQTEEKKTITTAHSPVSTHGIQSIV